MSRDIIEALELMVSVARSEPMHSQNGSAVEAADADSAHADAWDRALAAADKALSEAKSQSALRARLSQAGAGGGAVVRPLEWSHVPATAVCSERYDADGAGMTYSVYLRDDGSIQWSKNHEPPTLPAASINGAKAAAQADYEARIRAALAPSPSAGEPAAWMYGKAWGSGLSFTKPEPLYDDDGTLVEPVPLYAAPPAPGQTASGGEPVAWVIPGDDNARDDGSIDAMAWREGEFTRPLYATPPATPVQPTASVEALLRDTISKAAAELAHWQDEYHDCDCPAGQSCGCREFRDICTRLECVLIDDAATPSPAPVSAPATDGEATNKAEAILRRVRQFIAAEDKHERLMSAGKELETSRDDADFHHAQLVSFTVADCDAALRIVSRRRAALSNPAPGHGEAE